MIHSYKLKFKAFRQIAAISLLFGAGIFWGCDEKDLSKDTFTPNTGQIQVLNACGVPGAAEIMRNFLSQKGFDVVEFGNADYWNFDETIVVARTDNMDVARDLATIISTNNLIQLVDSARMVAATVYVGKDYFQRIQ